MHVLPRQHTHTTAGTCKQTYTPRLPTMPSLLAVLTDTSAESTRCCYPFAPSRQASTASSPANVYTSSHMQHGTQASNTQSDLVSETNTHSCALSQADLPALRYCTQLFSKQKAACCCCICSCCCSSRDIPPKTPTPAVTPATCVCQPLHATHTRLPCCTGSHSIATGGTYMETQTRRQTKLQAARTTARRRLTTAPAMVCGLAFAE
jgi:hypothetical protein